MSYQSLIDSYSPKAYYPLNEPDGSTVSYDASGNGYNGSIKPSISEGGPSIMAFSSPSYYFSGGHVSLPSNIPEVGYNVTQPNVYTQIYSSWVVLWMESSTPNNGYLFYLNGYAINTTTSGGLQFTLYNPNASLNHLSNFTALSSSNIFDGNRHCIIARVGEYNTTSSGSYTIDLYIDGVKQTTNTAGGYTANIAGMAEHASAIGSWYDGSSAFNGRISQISFMPYNSITQTDVTNIYNTGLDSSAGGPPPPAQPQPNAFEYVSMTFVDGGLIHVNYGEEIISLNVVDTHISAQGVEQLPPSLTTIGNFETFCLPLLKETMRLDLLAFLRQFGYCPPAPPPVIMTEGNSPTQSGGPNTIEYYNSGYYYRVPIDTTQTGSEPVPKYSTMFPQPYAAFVYPANDKNYGKMLIKTLTPLSGPVPLDVLAILQSDVDTDLQNDVNTIFAL